LSKDREFEWFKERVGDMSIDEMAHFLQLYDHFTATEKSYKKYVKYLMKELKSLGLTKKDIPYMEYCS